MNRRVARFLHSSTDLTKWFENPNWLAGTPTSRFWAKVLQKLPFSVTELQKRLFFDHKRVLDIGSEAVVVVNGNAQVDKFMFRRPREMSLQAFYERASFEVSAMMSCLSDIAQPTKVSIKSTDIFRFGKPTKVVTQTQPRIDLDKNKPFFSADLAKELPSKKLTRTIDDLKTLLAGVDKLAKKYNFYLYIPDHTDNLLRSSETGAITLIDVMPIYGDSTRLVADKPSNPNMLKNPEKNIEAFRKIVESYTTNL